MNWPNSPAAENEPGRAGRPGQEIYPFLDSAHPPQPRPAGAQPQGGLTPGRTPEIRIGKCLASPAAGGRAAELEVFTITLGTETIQLLPTKNWGQLDHHKWTARGRLPGEPAGLEIAADHVKITGGTVAINDPAGCLKLERLFNDWLQFERETLELARKKVHAPHPGAVPDPSEQPASQPLRFRVEVDKRTQVHIHCERGRETLASVGLNISGLTSLHQQGLMRKPRALATGALHDWVELDGELFSFEKGRNDAARLEQVLNERYVPEGTVGGDKQVVIFLNPASPTGFDMQFPVMVGGMPDNHRHHLNEHSLELLQDADHCGLLRKEIIIKLLPPNLVFKLKTPDGGEQYLPWSPENTVNVADDEGQQKSIQLSQPLNLLRLSAAELTAVFNHPAVNRHTQVTPPRPPAGTTPPKPATPGPVAQVQARPVLPAPAPVEKAPAEPAPGRAEPAPPPRPREYAPKPAATAPPVKPVEPARPLPNLWLKDILAQPALPQEWFSVLVYTRMAERFGNSDEGKFGPCECWFIRLGESEDIADPAFKGVFITEKGSLGYLNAGHMARFYNGVAFLGPRESALEGIRVNLIAVGLDAQGRLVFILSDNYRAQFGVQEVTVASVLTGLRQQGAVIMSVKEALASTDPIEVVWTVPTEQSDPSSPEARESTREPA